MKMSTSQLKKILADVSNKKTARFSSTNGDANASNQLPAKTDDKTHLEVNIKIEKAKSSSESTVPDGGWGWMVVLGSLMIQVIADGIKFSFGILVEEFVDYFECSKSAVGGVGSLMIAVGLGTGNVNLHLYRIITTTKIIIIIVGFNVQAHETVRTLTSKQAYMSNVTHPSLLLYFVSKDVPGVTGESKNYPLFILL